MDVTERAPAEVGQGDTNGVKSKGRAEEAPDVHVEGSTSLKMERERTGSSSMYTKLNDITVELSDADNGAFADTSSKQTQEDIQETRNSKGDTENIQPVIDSSVSEETDNAENQIIDTASEQKDRQQDVSLEEGSVVNPESSGEREEEAAQSLQTDDSFVNVAEQDNSETQAAHSFEVIDSDTDTEEQAIDEEKAIQSDSDKEEEDKNTEQALQTSPDEPEAEMSIDYEDQIVPEIDEDTVLPQIQLETQTAPEIELDEDPAVPKLELDDEPIVKKSRLDTGQTAPKIELDEVETSPSVEPEDSSGRQDNVKRGNLVIYDEDDSSEKDEKEQFTVEDSYAKLAESSNLNVEKPADEKQAVSSSQSWRELTELDLKEESKPQDDIETEDSILEKLPAEEPTYESDWDKRFAEAKRKFCFFWKNKDVFSQWHMSDFSAEEIDFTCAEQYMMYRKAMLFDSKDIASEILKTNDPRRMKALGRRVKKFKPSTWCWHCLDVVKEASMFKYTQNESMKAALFETYPRVLVEASPYDKIWGIGYEDWDEQAWDESTWAGHNLLGYILTEVRDELMYQERLITRESRRKYTEKLQDMLFQEDLERDPGTDVDYYYNIGGYPGYNDY